MADHGRLSAARRRRTSISPIAVTRSRYWSAEASPRQQPTNTDSWARDALKCHSWLRVKASRVHWRHRSVLLCDAALDSTFKEGYSMLRRTFRMSLAAAAFVPAVLYAQHPMPSKSETGKPAAKTSDAKQMADAMSAAPQENSN